MKRAAPGGPDAGWRDLWPWLLLPPLIVAGGVLWLWLGAEGGVVEAGRYIVR